MKEESQRSALDRLEQADRDVVEGRTTPAAEVRRELRLGVR